MVSELVRDDRNDCFSSFRGNDLKELLQEINSYLLEYRDVLNLPRDITFGCELEYERARRSKVDKFIETNLPFWESKKDGSLVNGGEITSPIMYDEEKCYKELKLVCDFLRSKKADTFHNAGGHVHIGARALGKDVDAWRQFLMLYTAYENVLIRFCYGDKGSGRSNLYKYARPISDLLYENIDYIKNAEHIFHIYRNVPNSDRRCALNFCNVQWFDMDNMWKIKNTLEFRCPNASVNPIVWQNNINAFGKMIVASMNKVMDEDFLNYKLENEFISYDHSSCLYDTVNLKNALEFVDLVFDNNYDKIYFLKQYLKDFKDSYGYNMAIPVKSFCKER